MVSGKSDLVDVTATKRMDKEKSIALATGRLDKDGREIWAWVPKSQVEDNGDGTFTMPEWLAMDKGLI